MGIVQGVPGLRRIIGAPVNGTDEVQTITITGAPTGGTFTLTFMGFETLPIAFNAAAAAVDTALEAVRTIGVGNVTAGGGALPAIAVTVTFTAALGRLDVPLLKLEQNGLTGGTTPTVTPSVTTPGVTATERGAPPGAVLSSDNGNVYRNAGTAAAPTWTAM